MKNVLLIASILVMTILSITLVTMRVRRLPYTKVVGITIAALSLASWITFSAAAVLDDFLWTLPAVQAGAIFVLMLPPSSWIENIPRSDNVKVAGSFTATPDGAVSGWFSINDVDEFVIDREANLLAHTPKENLRTRCYVSSLTDRDGIPRSLADLVERAMSHQCEAAYTVVMPKADAA